jgi:hypothetical protein
MTIPPEPPPPPSGDATSRPTVGPNAPSPLPHRSQLLVLATLLGAGALILLVDLKGPRGASGVFGAFLVAYTGLLLPGLVHVPFVGPRVARWGEEWMRDMGKGYYAVVALAVFLRLEASLLLRRIEAVLADESGIWSALAPGLPDLGISSLFNALYSMLWPFHLVNTYGYLVAALLAGSFWLAFWVGVRLFQPPSWLVADAR